MVAASILAIVGLLAGIWRFTNVGYAAPPATSWNQVALPETTSTPAVSQAPSASATPTASPSTAQSTTPEAPATTQATTKGPQVSAILRDNPLYDQAIAGSCPDQFKPTSLAESQAVMTAYSIPKSAVA